MSVSDEVFGEITEGGPNYRNIGLGVLSIPSAFDALGLIPGVICLVAIGGMITWGNYVVGAFKRNHPEVYSIVDVDEMMGGKIGKEFMSIAFMLWWICVAAAGFLSISTAFNALSLHGACTAVFVAVAAVIGFLTGSIRTLGKISWLAWIGVISIITALLTLTIVLIGNPTFNEGMGAIKSFVFAYAGTLAFFAIISEMRDPTMYNKAMYTCQATMTGIYVLVGVVVYYFCGSFVSSPALGSAGPLLKRVCYGLALPGLIVSTCLVTHYPAKYVFLRALKGSKHLVSNSRVYWMTWLSCTLGVTIAAYIICSAVPNFGSLISLVGALLATFMSLQPLGAMWLYDNLKRPSKGPRWMAGVAFALFVILIGTYIMVAGSYSAIVAIIDDYNSDTNNTVPAIRPNGLMDIPIEIRDMIWHLVLKDEQHVPMMSLGASSATFRYFKDVVCLRWYCQHNYQSNPPFLPSICRLSNYTHAETVRTFLRGTMFVSSSIADNNSLTGFLALIPGGFASIRGLYFDYFGRLPPNVAQNMDLELAVRCTGLRELKILMHNDVLASRPAQVAWTYYYFNRLLDCGNVGKVTIATMGYYNVTAAAAVVVLWKWWLTKLLFPRNETQHNNTAPDPEQGNMLVQRHLNLVAFRDYDILIAVNLIMAAYDRQGCVNLMGCLKQIKENDTAGINHHILAHKAARHRLSVMPVYTIPYDQSPRSHSLQTHFTGVSYRFVATGFPALSSTNGVQLTAIHLRGFIPPHTNFGQRRADVAVRTLKAPTEDIVTSKRCVVFKLPSLTGNTGAVNTDHADELNGHTDGKASADQGGEINAGQGDSFSTNQDEWSIPDSKMQVDADEAEKPDPNGAQEEAEQKVDTDKPKKPEKPTTLHRFMELPSEIRETIWDIAVRNEPYVVAGTYKRYFTHPIELRKYNTSDAGVFPFLPAVCRLSRETRVEAIHVFLRASTFFVCSYPENQFLTAFLSMHDGYRSVRGLHFDFFDFYNSRPEHQSDTNADLELCVRCTGLKEVKVRMHNARLGQNIWVPLEEELEHRANVVQRIWDFFRLGRLTACNGLTKVTILRKGWANAAGDLTAMTLVDRVEEEFRSIGRCVNVEAIYS
ncbi:hypothetical protein EKO04_010237 [Ascochyta lentis]|uniref:Amino acid transporter transmembrane domain-containing protein n=1 Tax=Ascochyta lentis TaxID=205686 RepID=A0A8H7ME30_9PLEO|nr:hypothetical protein EKO04_010237 [Ascochyta lentis]